MGVTTRRGAKTGAPSSPLAEPGRAAKLARAHNAANAAKAAKATSAAKASAKGRATNAPPRKSTKSKNNASIVRAYATSRRKKTAKRSSAVSKKKSSRRTSSRTSSAHSRGSRGASAHSRGASAHSRGSLSSSAHSRGNEDHRGHPEQDNGALMDDIFGPPSSVANHQEVNEYVPGPTPANAVSPVSSTRSSSHSSPEENRAAYLRQSERQLLGLRDNDERDIIEQLASKKKRTRRAYRKVGKRSRCRNKTPTQCGQTRGCRMTRGTARKPPYCRLKRASRYTKRRVR